MHGSSPPFNLENESVFYPWKMTLRLSNGLVAGNMEEKTWAPHEGQGLQMHVPMTASTLLLFFDRQHRGSRCRESEHWYSYTAVTWDPSRTPCQPSLDHSLQLSPISGADIITRCQMPLVCHVTHDLTSYLLYFLKDQVRPKEAENMCSSPSPRPGRSCAIRVVHNCLEGSLQEASRPPATPILQSTPALPRTLSRTLGSWRRVLSGLKVQYPTITATEKPMVLKDLQGSGVSGMGC